MGSGQVAYGRWRTSSTRSIFASLIAISISAGAMAGDAIVLASCGYGRAYALVRSNNMSVASHDAFRACRSRATAAGMSASCCTIEARIEPDDEENCIVVMAKPGSDDRIETWIGRESPDTRATGLMMCGTSQGSCKVIEMLCR